MPKVLMLVFAAACLLRPAVGQNPADLFSKAPQDVEERLRARVSKFFQLQVEGKFRQADQYVAEDSKDTYFEMGKTKYLKFEVRNINYSNEFKQAVVVVLTETYMPFPGFEGKPVPMPVKSTWKLVDGQWYWYVDQADANMTPFGKMNPGPDPKSGAAKNGPANVSPAQTLNTVLTGIRVDKRVVQLKTKEPSSDQVVVSKGLAGPWSVQLNPIDVPGLEIKFDPPEMKDSGKIVVTFRYDPRGATPPKAMMIYLIVSPLHYVIPVNVDFR
jgi:hypothetical protein